MHHREMNRIKAQVEEKGLTLIPLRIYFKRGHAKIELALAKGKNYTINVTRWLKKMLREM